MKKPSPRRADRALERCQAGGSLLDGKDPAGRFALVVVTSLRNGFAACFARTPKERANVQPCFLSGFSFYLELISSSASLRYVVMRCAAIPGPRARTPDVPGPDEGPARAFLGIKARRSGLAQSPLITSSLPLSWSFSWFGLLGRFCS